MWQANPVVVPVGVTVRAIVVLAVVLPDVPVMVTVFAPVVAVLAAVSVSTLLPVAGFVANVAVTPPGRPDAASVTLPVDRKTVVNGNVAVALRPCASDKLVGEADNVKPEVTLGFTVRAIVVLAVVLPDVPVMVTVAAPVVAVLVAVSVSTLLPVVGFVPNVAVTPLGRPDAASVTLPVNPPTSVTEIVSVALLPCVTDSVAANGASVKPAGWLVNVPTIMPRPLVPR